MSPVLITEKTAVDSDDPAIWVKRGDPAESLILGTDKQGGLAVYDLGGKQLQYLEAGRLNNVDVRYDVPLGDGRVDLVAAGNRTNDAIWLHAVDAATRDELLAICCRAADRESTARRLRVATVSAVVGEAEAPTLTQPLGR